MKSEGLDALPVVGDEDRYCGERAGSLYDACGNDGSHLEPWAE